MAELTIWQELEVTDPRATTAFDRGGFKGTAIKPIWMVKRMTEQFGTCGIGWGICEPTFQVVPAGNEILVYCTVSIWITEPGQRICGVGGDMVLQTFKKGKPEEYQKADDEAFKKAYTDALSNAMKFLGMGADIHMGRFEDSKYVDEAASMYSQKQWWDSRKEYFISDILDVKTFKQRDDLFRAQWKEMQESGLRGEDWKSCLQELYRTKNKELEEQLESEAA